MRVTILRSEGIIIINTVCQRSIADLRQALRGEWGLQELGETTTYPHFLKKTKKYILVNVEEAINIDKVCLNINKNVHLSKKILIQIKIKRLKN